MRYKKSFVILYCLITLLLIFWIFNDLFINSKFKLTSEEKLYLKENGNHLVFAGDISYPPFSFLDDSYLTGYESDLIQELEKLLNVDFRYLQIPWTDAIKELNKGTIDVLTGMKITTERQEKYLFTQPYLYTTQSIVASKSLTDIPSLDNLHKYDVIVQENSITHEMAKSNNSKTIFTVVNTADAWKNLSDDSDIWLENTMTALYHLRLNDQERFYNTYLLSDTSGQYAMSLSNNNRILAVILNKALHELEIRGTFIYLDHKWFGTNQDRPYNEPNQTHFFFISLYIGLYIGLSAFFIHSIWKASLTKQLDIKTKELQEANNIIEERKEEIHNLLDQISQSFAKAIDYRDMYTGYHSKRVAEISSAIATKLKLSDQEILQTYLGALIHDVGKVGIPDAILNKTDPLTKEEYAKIKEHPIIGFKILEHIETYDMIKAIVLYHHERWDGLTDISFPAYPGKVRGEQIPLPARIVAVADAFDAMTTDRPYRKALPLEVAIEKIRVEHGKQFDPKVVTCLVALLDISPFN